MTLEIFTCEQNSPEWFAARLGIPTASEFSTVMAKGRTKGTPSVTRRKYMNRLASERYMGRVEEEGRYTNAHLDRGHVLEPEAADVYAFAHDVELIPVGFYKHSVHRAGCSPDRLVKGGGLVSIKTALPHILTDYIRADKFPMEHMAQSQGELWITGEPWLDLVIYWPEMPLFVKRIQSAPTYIANLAAEVKAFNEELDEVEATLRAYGKPTPISDALRASLEELPPHEQVDGDELWTA